MNKADMLCPFNFLYYISCDKKAEKYYAAIIRKCLGVAVFFVENNVNSSQSYDCVKCNYSHSGSAKLNP